MTRRGKLLVIGLDSFDRGLAQRWMDEGALPNLAAQITAGIAAGVRNPVGMESGSLWPSFAYGCDPSHHGLYDGMRHSTPRPTKSAPFAPGTSPFGPSGRASTRPAAGRS